MAGETDLPRVFVAELHLDEDCGIQMVLCDDAGNVVATLAYALLASKPDDFDLDRFRRAWWDEWRGTPPALVS